MSALLFELDRADSVAPDRSGPVLPPAVEILRQVYRLGAWVVRNGDQLRLLAKPGSVPIALLGELRTHRSEILEILTTHACAECGRYAFPAPGTLCYWCRRP